MSNSRTPPSLPPVGAAGRRLARKRAPVFPAERLDQALIDLLAQADIPLSAYDIAARLRDLGRPLAVMSIYRALDRLCSRNAIEKIGMLSAYRIKDIPKAVLTICVSCGETRPLPASDVYDELEGVVVRSGFLPASMALEVAGLCADCRTQAER